MASRRRTVSLPRGARKRGRLFAYGYPELARLLGLSEAAVRQRVARGVLDPLRPGAGLPTVGGAEVPGPMTQLSFAAVWLGDIATGKMAARTDTDAIRAYVEGGGYATVREFDVYVACVRDGLSLAQTAMQLGLGYESVREYLARLRQRVRQPNVKRQRRVRMPMLRAA